MASQSYQLSFGVTVLVIFLCLILILVLLAAGLRAIFTLAFYAKHIWKSIVGDKNEQDKSKFSRSRRQKDFRDDYEHYADDECTDTTSDRTERSSDKYVQMKSKEE